MTPRCQALYEGLQPISNVCIQTDKYNVMYVCADMTSADAGYRGKLPAVTRCCNH